MDWRIFGGGGTPRLFTDTLLRTGVNNLGNPWILGYSDPSQAGWYNTTGGIFCNNTVGLTMRNPTGGGSSVSMPIIPAEFAGWNGKTQFARATLSAKAGASFDSGPAVVMTGDSSTGTANGYYLSIRNAVASVFTANVTQRVIAANVGTPAVNDIWQISVQFGASANTIIVKQNGTVTATLTDNNATRPLVTNGGVPGLFYKGAASATGSSYINFACGLGLGA